MRALRLVAVVVLLPLLVLTGLVVTLICIGQFVLCGKVTGVNLPDLPRPKAREQQDVQTWRN
jgi:hypothetical protein